MDTNEVEPEPAGVAPVATESEAGITRPSVLGASWRGAKTGFRWVSYVVGPVAAVLMGLGLALNLVGLWAGGLWDLARLLFNAAGFYVVSALWGAILGAIIGLIGWSIRLFRREAVPALAVETVSSRPPRRRWLRVVGIATLLVLAIPFGTGIYLWWTVDRRLADAIAAADRDDPNWRLDDLMAHRDAVPDAENAALVVAEALPLLPESWPTEPAPPPGQPAPPPSGPAQAYGRLVVMADNVPLDDATADVLRGELKTYDEAVRIARTVADYRRGRHELELGPTLFDTRIPETQATRAVARLMAADAAIRAHDGDADGALDSCRAILGVGRSIGDEPLLISQLVRVAIGLVAMQSAGRALGQGEPSDAALARLQSLILDEIGQPLLIHALRGERAVSAEVIRRVEAGGLPFSALADFRSTSDPDGPRTTKLPLMKLLAENQRALALEWMNAAVAVERRPVAERLRLWQAWQAEVDRVRLSRFGKYTATMPILMSPAVSSSHQAHARYRCTLGATAILLAAERHRRKAGDWPAAIDAIDEAILADAPIDPYSGRAFRMERRDGRLFIYSIGPNGRDEHGTYDPRKWMKGTTDDDAGAVGWDLPLRRR
jgi:hypothetical protein